jgi:hypothetical protein
MHSVRLAIEHTPETIHPMHAFVCASDAVDREVLLEGRTDDGIRTLLFHVEGDPGAYEAALAEQEEIIEYDVRPDRTDGFFLYVRAPNRDAEDMLFDAFERETVVVVPPTEFRSDMTMRLTVVGHSEDLTGLVDALPEALSVDILEVGAYDRAVGPTLTDRQREAIAAARDVGYYEIPREGDVEAVAAVLDCAVSTASTLLRRAEASLVDEALGTAW